MTAEDADRVFPLPEGEEGAWIVRARRLPVFACDAVFAISASVRVGPDDGVAGTGWQEANVALPSPGFARQFAGQASTAELLGREEALIGHYRRLVAVARAHGEAGSLGPFPHFRVKPSVVAEGEVVTAFSWTDDVGETRGVLEMLAGSAGGAPRLLHDDQDQRWRILVVATHGVTCFVEWDGEGPPPAEGGYAVDAEALARQAGAALDRLRVVHGRLVAALGRDHWSYRRPAPRVAPTNRVRSALWRLLGIGGRPGPG